MYFNVHLYHAQKKTLEHLHDQLKSINYVLKSDKISVDKRNYFLKQDKKIREVIKHYNLYEKEYWDYIKNKEKKNIESNN